MCSSWRIGANLKKDARLDVPNPSGSRHTWLRVEAFRIRHSCSSRCWVLWALKLSRGWGSLLRFAVQGCCAASCRVLWHEALPCTVRLCSVGTLDSWRFCWWGRSPSSQGRAKAWSQELYIHGGGNGEFRGPYSPYLSSSAMILALIWFSSLSQHVKMNFSFYWVSLLLA